MSPIPLAARAAVSERGFLSTGDGVRLAWYRWDPSRNPLGTVCLAHGHGEHAGRYSHVAGAFTAAGFAFLAFDLRGHGRSEGIRGHAPSYDHFLDDYRRLIEMAPAPRIAYGHSMGGQIVLNYGRKHPDGINGVIVTGAWLRLAFPAPAVKIALARALRAVLPKVTLSSGLKPVDLSRDPQVCREYADDPLVHDRLSFRTGIDLLEGSAEALRAASDFRLPVLLAHGDADRLMDHRATAEFHGAAGSSDKSLRIYPGHFHEIHNEPEWERVLADLIGWSSAHVG